jgi:GT2 family glycosyltransferase
VRWHARPIGLARLNAIEGIVSPAQLEAAVQAQVTIPKATSSALIASSRLISIIVCTHEHPDDLRRCLEALMPIAATGHEVLVVDNAPRTSQTSEIVTHYPYRYLYEPQIGLNNARNCGLYAASHAIVAYVDDDVVVDVNWAKAIVQSFETAEVGCVAGLVMPLELETPAQEQFEIYCMHRRDFTQRMFTAPKLAPAAAGVVGMGANMAFRRDLLLELGGFDPRLDGGTATCSGGDTDMFARVLEAGAQIVYTPDALVWHRHRREQDELHRCIFGYGVGLFSFLTKRLIENRDPQALFTAVRWFAGPLVKAAWRRLRGQAAVPLDLLLLEAGGACLGPWRFWQECRRVSKNITAQECGTTTVTTRGFV